MTVFTVRVAARVKVLSTTTNVCALTDSRAVTVRQVCLQQCIRFAVNTGRGTGVRACGRAGERACGRA